MGPPVFIVGADRSGTTLLRLYLNAGTTLAIPAESWFLIPLLETFAPDAVLDAQEIRRALELVTTHKRWKEGWRVPPHRLRAHFDGVSSLTLAEFVERIYTLEIQETSKARWGDKTPEYVFHMPALAAMFPNAKFVHIVRDGRDVVLSLLERRWPHRGWSPYQLGRYWVRSVRAARQAAQDLGAERFYQLKYEDLVLQPRETLGALCDFLGIPFEQQMLDFYHHADEHITDRERSHHVHSKLSRPPERSDVGRWRREGSRQLVGMIAGMVADELTAYRYPSPPSRVRAAPLRLVAAGHFFLWLPALARYKHLRRVAHRQRLRQGSNDANGDSSADPAA